MTRDRTPILAVFCDFENVALGVRDAKYKRFDIRKVLERLLLKGSIVVKKAYCDWDRYKPFKPAMHEAAFELIEIPHLRQSGKNSADIRMVVDALDLCYTKSHVNTFVIISGDSDFSPLVSKLRENDKAVIGVGVANSSSDLLIANCDEFIYYDDLVRSAPEKKPLPRRPTAPAAAASEPMTTPERDWEMTGTDPGPAAPSRRSSRRGTRGRGGARETAPETAVELNEAAAPVADEASGSAPAENAESAAEKAAKGIELICETVAALMQDRGEEQKIWGSMVKQTLRRRRPGFNESFHGFRSFNAMLEEAEHRGRLHLEKDDKSGGYIILAPQGGLQNAAQVAPPVAGQTLSPADVQAGVEVETPDPDQDQPEAQPEFEFAPPAAPKPAPARRRRSARKPAARARQPGADRPEPDGNRADPAQDRDHGAALLGDEVEDSGEDSTDAAWNV